MIEGTVVVHYFLFSPVTYWQFDPAEENTGLERSFKEV